MSTDIVTTLYTDYVKPFQTHLVVIFVVIIFTLASYMAYNWYIKPTVENLNACDISNDKTRTSESKYIFFTLIGVLIVKVQNLNGTNFTNNTITKQ